MQPGTEPPGSRRARDDDENADTAGIAPRAGVARPVRRARIGLLLLFAFMTEVIVIAAAGNQAVTDKILSNAGPHTLKGGFEESLETFAWRVSPRSNDIFHVWAGSLSLIGATVVLSLLLIFATVRGPLTFGRAFFGTWLSVIVATMLGGYVRGLVIDTPARSTHGIPARALFSTLAPGSTTFLAGVALGLVVALVVAIFGVVTRRPDDAALAEGDRDELSDNERAEAGYGTGAYGAAGYGDPGYGRGGYGTGGYGAGGYGAGGYGAGPAGQPYGTPYPQGEQSRGYGGPDEPTRAVPWQDAPSDSTETTALPTMRPRDRDTTDPSRAVNEPAGAEAHTTALPRTGQESSAAAAQTAPTEPQPTEPEPTQAVPAQPEPTQAAPGPAGPRPTQAMPVQAPEEGVGSEHASAQQTTQFPRPPTTRTSTPSTPVSRPADRHAPINATHVWDQLSVRCGARRASQHSVSKPMSALRSRSISGRPSPPRSSPGRSRRQVVEGEAERGLGQHLRGLVVAGVATGHAGDHPLAAAAVPTKVTSNQLLRTLLRRRPVAGCTRESSSRRAGGIAPARTPRRRPSAPPADGRQARQRGEVGVAEVGAVALERACRAGDDLRVDGRQRHRPAAVDRVAVRPAGHRPRRAPAVAAARCAGARGRPRCSAAAGDNAVTAEWNVPPENAPEARR